MGRNLYTPSTISWLASQAGSRSDDSQAAQRSGASEPCACSSINGGLSCSDAVKCAERMLPVPSTRRHKTDTPYVWSQHRFDPDDESLPVVDETFLDGPESESNEILLREHRALDDAEQEEDEEHGEASDSDEDHVEGEEDVADYTEEVTEEILDDDGTIWSLARPDEAVAPDASQHSGFSPSVGVFHTHTLPFFLPAVGSMQRRASDEHAVTPSTGAIALEA